MSSGHAGSEVKAKLFLNTTFHWPWGQSEQCAWSEDTGRRPRSASETAWPPPPSETPSQPGSRRAPRQTPAPESGWRLSCFQRCRARWWCCCAESHEECWPRAQSLRGSLPAGWRTAAASWWIWQHTRLLSTSPCTYGRWQTVHYRKQIKSFWFENASVLGSYSATPLSTI